MSQQAFATALDMSIRAVANYEVGRVPDSVALGRLYSLALKNDEEKLAAVFHEQMLANPMTKLTAMGIAAYAYLMPHCEELREVGRILRAAPPSPEVEAAIAKLDTAIERTVTKFKRYYADEAGTK